MRKKLGMILLILLSVLLTACSGGDKKVPEAEIEYVVEDYLYVNALDGYVGADFEATHSWDAEAKIDSVQLEVVTEYAYGYVIAECECVFQYDKSSDMWNVKRMSQWSERVDYGDKFEGVVFSGTDEDITYTVEIESIDFATGEIAWNYQVYGMPDGYYPWVEFVGSESTNISMHNDDAYTITTVGGAEKEVQYFTVSLSSSSLYQAFMIDFTVRGLEDVFFWA